MPQVFKIGAYLVYFWSDESKPLEPIHVHVGIGKPSVKSTKLWITEAGKVLLCHNRSEIPERDLRRIIRMIEANREEVIRLWLQYFEEICYYC